MYEGYMKVKLKYILFFSLFTFHFSLFTSQAETVKALHILQSNGTQSVTRLDKIDSLTISEDETWMFVSANGDNALYPLAYIEQMTFVDIDDAAMPSITWNGSSVEIVNPLEVAGVSITANGTDVTINSTYSQEIEYALYGSSTDGSLKIYSTVKYRLTMNNLSLTNPTGPAINNQSKKKGTIVLPAGTVNTLTDGTSYAASTEDQKGCFFSEGQLIFTGTGTLKVYGNYKHGICADDYLEFRSGQIQVTTTAAAAKAIKANRNIFVKGGSIAITQSGNKVIETDDVSYCMGLRADTAIYVSGGQITVNSSAEGGRALRAQKIEVTGGEVVINLTGSGGTYTLNGTSDTFTTCGLKTDGDMSLLGGTITINATGSKGTAGIKADGALTIGTATAGPTLTVHTTGSAVSQSSSSGMGGKRKYLGDPKAVKVEGAITMLNGNVELTTTGTGGEGLESKTSIDLNGGFMYVSSQQDDAINSSGKITFGGAYVYAYSAGNDAVDSNYGRSGAITISGGVAVAISGAGSPEEGFDCDNNSYLVITGGCALSAGGSQGGGGGGPGGGNPWEGGGISWGSSSTIGSSTQGYVLYTSSWNMSASKYYHVMDASGNVLFSFPSPTASVRSSLSLVTAETMTQNSTYYVKYSSAAPTNPTINMSNRIFKGGTVSSATQVFSFTAIK